MTASVEREIEWDLADRMRKALRLSGVEAGEMAEYLGVGRQAVSAWINGRVTPKVGTLRLWALRTGVPFEWLNSEAPSHEDGACIVCAARESNPQPADKEVGRHLRLVPPLPPPRHLQAVRVAS